MALAWLFVNIFTTLFLGFRTSIIQSNEDNSILFNIIFLLEPLLAVISVTFIYFLASPIGTFFNSALLTQILPLLSLVLLITSFDAVPSLKLEKELLFEKRIVPAIIREILFPLIAIPLALLGYGVLSLVYGVLVGSVASLVSVWILAPWIPKLRFSGQITRKVMNKGIQYALVGYLLFLLINVDKGIIGKFAGSEMLGFYSIAFLLASIPVDSLAEVMGKVSLPALSQSLDEEYKLRAIYERFLQLIVLFTLPFVVIVIPLAWEITFYFYTEKWLPMVRLLQILSIYGLFRAISVSYRDLLNALGRPELLIKLNLIQLAILAGLSIPVILNFGVIGLSVLWTITTGAVAIYLSYFVKKLLKLNLIRIYSSCIIAAVITMILVLFLKEIGFIQNLLSLIFVISMGGFVNGLIIIIQRPELPRQYKSFLSSVWK